MKWTYEMRLYAATVLRHEFGRDILNHETWKNIDPGKDILINGKSPDKVLTRILNVLNEGKEPEKQIKSWVAIWTQFNWRTQSLETALSNEIDNPTSMTILACESVGLNIDNTEFYASF